MRHNIYLTKQAENALTIVFEYLKTSGDIPTNATEIGPYRAQVLTWCLDYTLGGLATGPDTRDFIRQLNQREKDETINE